MMTEHLPPFVIFILGAVLAPFLPCRLRKPYTVALPVVVFWYLVQLPLDAGLSFHFLNFELHPLAVTRLSKVFGYIFSLLTFIGMIYSLHHDNMKEKTAAFLYAGFTLGVVFAGDLLTLFFFWELMTIAAGYMIWTSDRAASRGAGLRYILVHAFGGVCLLTGILMRIAAADYADSAILLTQIGLDGTVSSALILTGFLVNAAAIGLHAWLPDAYPSSSITGAVFLVSFTTKTAVYVLAQTFAGTTLLLYVGGLMTIYPIFFAVLENDLRRVLSYSLINQVGFMLVGIGVGTQLGINGAAAHAFCHVLYKGLLFMSVGSVMYVTGTSFCSKLGGLYRTMPWTMTFCIVGAASISAFPLFNGFVSKSLTMSAVTEQHMRGLWLVLLFASAGVLHHAGIKVPFTMFFAHDSGLRPPEPPLNMRIAMGFTAFLCIFTAVQPQLLYAILPYPEILQTYHPYTPDHVLPQLQLLCFAGLAFAVLHMTGRHPAEVPATYLDCDWFYRKGARAWMWVENGPMAALSESIRHTVMETIPSELKRLMELPARINPRPVGATAFWVAAFMLILFFTQLVVPNLK